MKRFKTLERYMYNVNLIVEKSVLGVDFSDFGKANLVHFGSFPGGFGAIYTKADVELRNGSSTWRRPVQYENCIPLLYLNRRKARFERRINSCDHHIQHGG